MKRTVKKLVAAGLTLTSVMSLVACGSSSSNSSTTASKSSAEVTKPDKFTVMADGTVVTEQNGGEAFYEYLKSLTDLDIEWVRPDHSGYYDAVGNAFNSEDGMPDVLLLSADYYSLYAASGFLWNMTDAWNNSETKNSGRLIDTADNVLNALMVNGEDGKQGMYGLSTYRGNGCVTYVKETWLNQAGYTREDVENKTLTFDEYYAMCKKMHEVTGKSVISAAGFIGTEAPYTNYLPEFYQQAHYTFYKDSTGKYVDGFNTQEMKDALTRISKGVADGVIDQESINNSTSNVRDKFDADESGVFTYWAGKWAETLRDHLAGKGLDDKLVTLKPIKELGTYVERIAPAWCITTHAQNPEGIFKYFIDTMLDGGDVQTAWTYGAKGTHWDTKAETVTLEGAEDKGTTYTEGQFHMLPSPEKPNSLMQANNIDPLLSLAKFKNGDPGEATIAQNAKDSIEFFANNSTVVSPVPMTEELGDNIADINKERNIIVAAVATGTMTADQGMTEYTAKVGNLVDTVLKSLNK